MGTAGVSCCGGAPSVSAYFARLAEEQAHEEDLLALVDRLDAEDAVRERPSRAVTERGRRQAVISGRSKRAKI